MATILVVDDRPISREFLVTLLGYCGHRVLEAENGAEAFKLAQAEHPELVITDIAMPVMNGCELARNLRADPKLAGVPVIFYTATYRVREARSLGRSSGAFAVLRKPTSPQKFLSTIAAALGLPESTLRPQPHAVSEQEGASGNGSRAASVLESSDHRLTTLVEASLDLTSERDPEKLIETFCRMGKSICEANYSAVGALDADRQSLQYLFRHGIDPEPADRLTRPAPSDGLLEHIIEGRRPIRLSEVSAAQVPFLLPPDWSRPVSFLGVPMLSPSGVRGWLVVLDKQDSGEFSEEDERLASRLAAMAAVAYENIWLEGEVRRTKDQERVRQEQLRLKDEFLSHVSHELRSPLTAIYQFTTILLDGLAGTLSTEQREYLGIVLRNAGQLRRMIDDLLTVTSAGMGKLVLRRRCADAREVILQTVGSLQTKAAQKAIYLGAEVAPGLPGVWADPERVREVLTNLMDNAIKFTPRGGRVSVQARLFEEDPNFVCVAVSDTGCGINAEHQQRIFERLFQASNPGGARSGLGLGLFISKDLVSRQGGRIWVESHPGRGSTFFFTLPVFSLARQICPLLRRKDLPERSIALIVVELFPREEHSHIAHDTGAAEVAREILERCVRPQWDLVLPALHPGAHERRLFVLACADQAGARAIVERIEKELRASKDLEAAGVELKISSATVDIPSLKGDTPVEALADEAAKRVELAVGRAH